VDLILCRLKWLFFPGNNYRVIELGSGQYKRVITHTENKLLVKRIPVFFHKTFLKISSFKEHFSNTPLCSAFRGLWLYWFCLGYR